MTPAGEELTRLLDGLGPSELALRDWLRPRLTAPVVGEMAASDHGMDVERYREGIEDLLVARRLPEHLDGDRREILRLCSHRPGRGHAARLFACLVLSCDIDLAGPAETVAALVESALELGPEAAGHAVSFLAWCRLREPGGWRYDDEGRPFLLLGLLLLAGADPAVADGLLRAFVAEVTAVSPPVYWWRDGTPSAMLREAAGGAGFRLWQRLIRRSPVAGCETLRAWFRIDRPAT